MIQVSFKSLRAIDSAWKNVISKLILHKSNFGNGERFEKLSVSALLERIGRYVNSSPFPRECSYQARKRTHGLTILISSLTLVSTFET
jgi:hypothetical protein